MTEHDRLPGPATLRPPRSLTATRQRARGLLEGAAACERASARILRARGHEAAACRAERSAARIGLTLDEPQAVALMRTLVRELSGASDHHQLLECALDGALSLLGAALGCVQLRDEATGTLRIAAHRGFGRDFLEHFAVVVDSDTAGGLALERRSQTVIVDVNADPGFAEHRSIARASGFRAVQCTPLINDDDRLLGIISTHFRHPRRPRVRDLEIMAWYGELTARAMSGVRSAPAFVYESAGACHEKTADLHDAVASAMRGCALSLGNRGAERDAAQATVYASQAQERALLERERGWVCRQLLAHARQAERPAL